MSGQSFSSPWSRVALLLVVIPVAFLLTACSKSALPAGPTGTLTGKVTYNGAPAPAGSSISLMHDETGLSAVGLIEEGGVYVAKMQGQPNILAGKYHVAVAGPPAAEMSDDDMAAMYEGKADAPTASAIPAKYADVDNNGLTFEVKEGENTYDVDLKD